MTHPAERVARHRTAGTRLSLSPPAAEEFKALYDQTGWGNWPLETFRAALDGSWLVCTARDDTNTLVGIGRLISDGALHAFVTEMIVDERARGNGIGSRILAQLVAEARTRGIEDVQLFAARGKADFYTRNGFASRAVDAPGMDLSSCK